MNLKDLKIKLFADGANLQDMISVYKEGTADGFTTNPSLMKQAVEICHAKPNVELLWASCREFYNILEAEAAGCDIITVQNSILAKSQNYGKDLKEYSLETVQSFYKDASGLGFSIV